MSESANTWMTRRTKPTTPARRLQTTDLMPPEEHYRPQSRSPGGRGLAWFLIWMIATFMLFWSTASMAAIGSLILVASFVLYWQRHSHADAVESNQDAIKLLNDGHVDEAGRRFEELAQEEQKTHGHAVFVHNRAVAYMLQGKLKRAFSLFNAVDRSRHFRWGPNRSYEPLLYAEMATCLALMGELGEAREYRDIASSKLPPSEMSRLALVDTILGLRHRRFEDVLRLLDSVWTDARELLRVPTFRALMVLRAYALENYGSRYEDQIRSLLSAAGSKKRGEFDYLAVDWPEFRDFLRARGLYGMTR